MRAWRSAGGRKPPRDKGATFVEYGLLVGLFVMTTLGAIDGLTTSASDDFSESASNVGHPAARTITTTPSTLPPTSTTAAPTTTTTAAPTTTTTVAPTTTTVAPTTTTTQAPPPDPDPIDLVIDLACSGTRCATTVDVPDGVELTWTLGGEEIASGPTLDHSFPTEPGTGFWNLSPTTSSYLLTVHADPPPTSTEVAVTCTGTWWSTTCTVG